LLPTYQPIEMTEALWDGCPAAFAAGSLRITRPATLHAPRGLSYFNASRGAIGSGLGGWLLDVFDLSLQNLIVLMDALMLSFGVNWIVNGVWGTKKLATRQT